jgi:hypothetical protein
LSVSAGKGRFLCTYAPRGERFALWQCDQCQTSKHAQDFDDEVNGEGDVVTSV